MHYFDKDWQNDKISEQDAEDRFNKYKQNVDKLISTADTLMLCYLNLLDFHDGIIKDLKYIVQNKTAFISQSEYSQLITKENFIISKLSSYIKKYIKALEHQEIKKNYLLCSMSCLKYFHDELNIKTSY